MKRVIIGEVLVVLIIIVLQQFAGEWYAQNIYPFVSAILSWVGGIFPFSLGDHMIVGLYVALVVLLFWYKITFLKRLSYFLTAILGMVIWFYLSWGINYSRDDIYTRTNTEQKRHSNEEFKTFTDGFIDRMNIAYNKYDSLASPDFTSEIISAYTELTPRFNLQNPPYNSFKPMISSALMMKLGVSGYFNPFFGEYHINNDVFSVSKPFTFAHEAAHKAGVTSEAEANLMAYLICSKSNNPNIQFSSYFSVLSHILSSIYSTLGEDALKESIASINPEIIELKRREMAHYAEKYSTTLGDAQSYIYDKFLKANNIKSGSGSYGEVVGLLLDFTN